MNPEKQAIVIWIVYEPQHYFQRMTPARFEDGHENAKK